MALRRCLALGSFWLAFGSESCSAALKVKLRQGTAVLEKPVFYGRPILRIPKTSLLEADEDLRRRVRGLKAGPLSLGSDMEAEELLLLAAALLREARASLEEPAYLLQLSARQMAVLAGTTVESMPSEAQRLSELLVDLGATQLDAQRAIGMVLRRALQVQQEDGRRRPRLTLLPELLPLRHNPDVSQAPAFVETVVNVSGQLAPVLLRSADRDFKAGEEIFLWSGRFSDSELLLRGLRRSEMKNPTGFGGKVQVPENWNSNPRTPNYKEFLKFNCTSQEAFEVRLSKKGWPMRSFVRCYRVAWLLLNGHYTPQVLQQTQLLDKWPPPKKYSHANWLAWTQADQATNAQILDYCQAMRRRLRESISSAMAEDFRHSADPIDQQLWRLRREESKAFKECVSLAKSAGTDR